MVQNQNKGYLILLYDDTLNGLLTAIFDSYRLQLDHFDIQPEYTIKEKLFKPILEIKTNNAKANRIKLGLRKKTGQDLLPYLQQIFVKNETKEKTICQLIQKVFI